MKQIRYGWFDRFHKQSKKDEGAYKSSFNTYKFNGYSIAFNITLTQKLGLLETYTTLIVRMQQNG